MGYFTKTEIEELVPPAVKILIQDADYFTAIAGAVDLKIQKIIGGTIPTTRDEDYDWIVLPAAYITAKLCLPKINNISDEGRNQIIADSQEAINDLERFSKDTAYDYEASNSGDILTVEEW